MARGDEDLFGILAGFLLPVLSRKDQLAVACDGVEGGAELVAHPGKKLLPGAFPEKRHLMAPKGRRNHK